MNLERLHETLENSVKKEVSEIPRVEYTAWKSSPITNILISTLQSDMYEILIDWKEEGYLTNDAGTSNQLNAINIGKYKAMEQCIKYINDLMSKDEEEYKDDDEYV